MIKRLSDADARAIPSECALGRLGCVEGGCPYVVPVNYLFEGGCIYVHSLPGRKVEAMRAEPRACSRASPN